MSLETKRTAIENFTEMGLYPYSRFYLKKIKDQFGEYWKNHFNTIGLLGLNESLINFIGKDIATVEGHALAEEILNHMRNKLKQFQEETGHLYNLEASPAEGTTYRFAKADKKRYADIVVANEQAFKEKNMAPYYTNSSQLPVFFTDDVFEALDLQDSLQTKYTGGTVLHVFLGEKMPSVEATKNLIRKIAENYKLPYYTLTPTFSICPIHGYLAGEHEYCPKCDEEAGYNNKQLAQEDLAEQKSLFS
jgi:ribonucleoside-triphosphate reductase